MLDQVVDTLPRSERDGVSIAVVKMDSSRREELSGFPVDNAAFSVYVQILLRRGPHRRKSDVCSRSVLVWFLVPGANIGNGRHVEGERRCANVVFVTIAKAVHLLHLLSIIIFRITSPRP